MKKLISLCLAVLLAALPLSSRPARAAAAPSYNAAAVDAAGELIQTGILRKYVDSDSYAYWNFYISSDSDLLHAYAYRYADAVSHLDLIKTLWPVTISKDDAKAVLQSYMEEFLLQNNEKYTALVYLEKLLGLMDRVNDAADLLRDNVKDMTESKLSVLRTALNRLKKDEPIFQNALVSGQLDPTTEKWAVKTYSDLEQSMSRIGVSQEHFEMLSTLSVTLKWGLKVGTLVFQWSKTKVEKSNTALEACYAAQDCCDFYTQIARNAINDNVRTAAEECAKELEEFKGKNPEQCLRIVNGNAGKEFTVQTFLDFAGSRAVALLEKKFPALGAVDTGVKISNFLLNIDKTTEQVNKIRVMAVISLALADKVCECETEYTANWRNLPAKEDASNRLLQYAPMLMLARELGEKQYYNMREDAGDGPLSKLLRLFLGSDTTLEDWYKNTTSNLKQMRSQAEGILSAAKADPSNVSNAEKEKISAYLGDIADLETGSMPPFDRIENLDKTWTIQSLWSKTASKNYIDYTSETGDPGFGAVSLASIEKEARRSLNPSVSLPASGDYGSFKGQSILTPRWVPSQKLFAFPPADFPTICWIYPISSAIKSGDSYKITCAEIYYVPKIDTWGLTDSTEVLFCNGKRVGTKKDGTESAPAGFQYETDPTKLPQIQFILQSNGKGGYYVLAKSGAQSKCKFPEDEDASSAASGSSAPAASSGGELTQEQALDLARKYYVSATNDKSDLSASVNSSENQTFKGETCCLVKIKKGPKNQEQTIALFLVGLKSGNLYQKDLKTGQCKQVQTGSAGSAQTKQPSGSLTEDQACKIATDYVRATLHPNASITALYGDAKAINGESCYSFELREEDGSHESMLGMFLVGKNSRNLYRMNPATGDYKKVS